MRLNTPLALTTMVVGLASAQPAAAATLIVTGNWSNVGSGSIAKFDPTLGALNAITVEMDASVMRGYWLTSMSGPVSVDAALAGTLQTNIGSAAYQGAISSSTSSRGSFAVEGTGHSVTQIAADGFSPFVGTGQLGIHATGSAPAALTFTNFSGMGGWSEPPAAASMQARFRVIYDYTVAGVTAVPEPATWSMLIAGFGVVGIAVRRRQRSEAATVAA
ncbi:hypothetical protein GGR88_002149 [Sphingomonas jejuensis]|uniref:Ice-binding protein C-terminal domain-containing protein n=1 Tax=Sphingomonas jejuensis TaxID=904715 RepID=A0ABX0XN21_9SPHN|nr:PEPxxWA-CTERM sorting domain-containing protein [Sphingomonas jejuensis]NJC34635.1 hypothetical protein [Sphingomonas jejuensis]